MLKLYNTLSRKIEVFAPISGNTVKMYSCGPTVYDYQHIGHMRRYVGDDILTRVLKLNGYKVNHAMNITDVGHLVSDSDTGEDKMEKGAKKFGKTVWEIAKEFEKQFIDSCRELNIHLPKDLMHATGFINEQIALIKILGKKGYTYKISDGIYFDTSKFPQYFSLSRQNPEELKKGARVDFVEGKRNVADFALWKFSYPHGKPFEEFSKQVILGRSDNVAIESFKFPKGSYQDLQSFQDDNKKIQKRQMEWESPWGVGFPGWHVECSAMAMKALGETLDIHTGGIDHINIHHTNEIAQSEAATGKQFVRFWVHHNFLEVEGQKMSKSLGNFYTVQDVMDRGFDPVELRYLYLQTHYRQEMNFTWEALSGARTAYHRLIGEISNIKYQISKNNVILSEVPLIGTKPENPIVIKDDFGQEPLPEDKHLWGARMTNDFLSALNDDLNTPKALAVVWELIKSEISASQKILALRVFDRVLGLELFIHSSFAKATADKQQIPQEVLNLIQEREVFRKSRDFTAADEIRKKIYDLGYKINDSDKGPQLVKFDK